MGITTKIFLFSFLSGITVFIGGVLSALFEKYSRRGIIKEEIIHTATAFGGGIILAAVSFVLVPKGMASFSLPFICLSFAAGALSFLFLDSYLQSRGGAVSQLLAMMMDFVPEAIALGAVFNQDSHLGILLALFIGAQNLPESFNAFRDLRESGYRVKKSLTILFLLSFVGPLSALTGFYLLQNLPQVTSAMMLFASGGILYLVFQDIAPMSRIEKCWTPALGANMGYLVGMIGQKLLG